MDEKISLQKVLTSSMLIVSLPLLRRDGPADPQPSAALLSKMEISGMNSVGDYFRHFV